MKLTIIAIILCVSLGAKAQQDSTEMKKAIDAMQKMYSVHFVSVSYTHLTLPTSTTV